VEAEIHRSMCLACFGFARRRLDVVKTLNAVAAKWFHARAKLLSGKGLCRDGTAGGNSGAGSGYPTSRLLAPRRCLAI
jgi:hypothetical protein